jgi:DNA-binding beta-propeller fold protein YncE
MKKYTLLLTLIILLLTVACSLFSRSPQPEDFTPSPFPTSTTIAATASYTAQPTLMLQPSPAPTQLDLPAGEVRRQWAADVVSDLLFFDVEFAIGAPGQPDCENIDFTWLNSQANGAPAVFYVQFYYQYPVTPTEINLTIAGNPDGLLNVELFNATSGLGLALDEVQLSTDETCLHTVSIPVQTELIFDTVILTFRNTKQPFRIEGAELVGVLHGYTDLPVFWRISIPADDLADPDSQFPGGLAVDAYGNLFLANGRNGLYRYDVEGNLLHSYSVPSEANITDVTADQYGNLVVTDNVYQWFITLSLEGEQLNAAGEDFGWNNPREAAINPVDGNIYLLDASEDSARIRVYTLDTAEWIRDLRLESGGIDTYKGLAFDAQGYLYTIDQNQSAIIKIDPINGETLNTLGYIGLAGTSPSDLALDKAGNLFVLLSTSRDDSAVYILDTYGNIDQRLGSLSYECADWSEGIFCFPVGIAVTPDGRFLFILENGYLTAYWMEE